MREVVALKRTIKNIIITKKQATASIAFLIVLGMELATSVGYSKSPFRNQPIVIAVVGPMQSVSKYVDMFPAKQIKLAGISHPPKAITFNIFPIHTKSMTPGKVKARTVNLPMFSKPIFIVGSDQMSLNWLRQYSSQLMSIHAVGVLVEAKSKSDLDTVKAIIGSLTVIPISGDVISNQLHLKHYPVLISQHLIKQGKIVNHAK